MTTATKLFIDTFISMAPTSRLWLPFTGQSEAASKLMGLKKTRVRWHPGGPGLCRRLVSGNSGTGTGLPFPQAALGRTVKPAGSLDCMESRGISRQRMRGEDGFCAFSSVALAMERASLRSLSSCECLTKWSSAPGRTQASSSLASGLNPGRPGVALLPVLGLGPQAPPFTLLGSTSSGRSGRWLSALSWPHTKLGVKSYRC